MDLDRFMTHFTFQEKKHCGVGTDCMLCSSNYYSHAAHTHPAKLISGTRNATIVASSAETIIRLFD